MLKIRLIKIIVTGSSSSIGREVISYLKGLNIPELNILCPSHVELDIRDKKAVSKYFEKNIPFDIILNFAAYTNVSLAERERDNKSGNVWKTNVIGTKNIIDEAKKSNSYLIHISTEAVFSGTKDYPGPYNESHAILKDSTKITWYGWTKALNEFDIQQILNRYAIIRITNPIQSGKVKKSDYIHKMIYSLRKNKDLTLFTDIYTTISPVEDLCKSIYTLIFMQKSGIFHIASSNICTPFMLMNYFLNNKYKKYDITINETKLEDFINKTQSNHRYLQFGGLNADWTYKNLNMIQRTWQEVIDNY